ncbi:NAD(P)H-dependent flavin oxidoreductase [Thermoactinomyces mirandus]|uniref:Probable nitronate monooxygenase n=1 Tax=Thermoactinomyces mirandus TaxID=2756294 RepID=A0A7W1XSI9_9BACL|nr:nitronate monooxygenase [Thermoactinomyces mirandus]MBA4602487.1 nitronate monooxygenase [Thermoactinomyces mirandus]
MTWYRTKLTEMLKISYPVIQAGMAGGVTSPELVAAVSNSGGLGTLGAGYLSPVAMRQAIRDIRKLTDRPFAVNLMVPQPCEYDFSAKQQMKEYLRKFEKVVKAPTISSSVDPSFSFDDQVNVVLEEKVPIFSFTFGIPDSSVIEEMHSNQTIVIGTATTVKEAIELEKSGVDAVVAQGCEAGGHRGTFQSSSDFPYIGLIALVPQMVDHINIPVIASGGIMDGRGILASLSLGAAGVQMGSAFLTTLESNAHEQHKKALIESNDESTVITAAFSGRPARGIKNTFIREMEHYPGSIPPYPVQNEITKNMRKYAAIQGNPEYMSLWGGQASSLSRLESAEDLMKKTIEQVDQLIGKFSDRGGL